MESDIPQESFKSSNQGLKQIVHRAPDDLRPHPSYAKHGLTVPAGKLSALRALGELAFVEPLAITCDRIIMDGYARWQIAKESGRPKLDCIEYDLPESEALGWLLQKHLRVNSLNDYSRIMLALDLEPVLTEKAKFNRQIGGLHKGWSNLTRAEQVHVRSEIAKAAAVSTGNVTKVKQLNAACIDDLKKALYNDEISIHWAWKLRKNAPDDQGGALAYYRFKQGLRKEIRKRALRRRRQISTHQNAQGLVNRLSGLGNDKLEAVPVTILKGLKPEIFITEALARTIGLEQLRLWNQNAICKILPRVAESFLALLLQCFIKGAHVLHRRP